MKMAKSIILITCLVLLCWHWITAKPKPFIAPQKREARVANAAIRTCNKTKTLLSVFLRQKPLGTINQRRLVADVETFTANMQATAGNRNAQAYYCRKFYAKWRHYARS